ncbi:MAG: hypothetical protein J7647_28795 [Cyanobacteria bacterium SBLK]|nr:hypothetical protein [Cyanobacteria bacterium SBLK]
MTTGKVWPNAILLSGGIALILCGGCFLIGVMLMISPFNLVTGKCTAELIVLTPDRKAFLNILYGGAFGCFGASVLLIATSVRRLLKITE